MRTVFFAATIAVVCSFSAIASADEPDPSAVSRRRVYFGQLVGISTAGFKSSIFAYQTQSSSTLRSRDESESFLVSPSADVRVVGMLTVGLTLAGTYQRLRSSYVGSTGTDTSTYGMWRVSAQPRLGLLIPLGKRLAVWPRAGVGYALGWSSAHEGFFPPPVASGVIVDADVQVMLGVTREIFFALGPTASWSSLSSSDAGSSGLALGAAAGFGLAF